MEAVFIRGSCPGTQLIGLCYQLRELPHIGKAGSHKPSPSRNWPSGQVLKGAFEGV